MNIFTIIFLQNFSKIFSKTHQIAPFLKIFSGEHAGRTPLASAWLRAMQIPPLLQKKLNPPPPRNEILDKPLVVDQ